MKSHGMIESRHRIDASVQKSLGTEVHDLFVTRLVKRYLNVTETTCHPMLDWYLNGQLPKEYRYGVQHRELASDDCLLLDAKKGFAEASSRYVRSPSLMTTSIPASTPCSDPTHQRSDDPLYCRSGLSLLTLLDIDALWLRWWPASVPATTPTTP